MENYLLNYDEITGEIKGFYLRSVHGGGIPSPTIEISPEKHNFYMENNGLYKLNTSTLDEELVPIPEQLPHVKTIEEINTERITSTEDAINMIMTML